MPKRPWQVWLVAVLLLVTAAGCFAWAVGITKFELPWLASPPLAAILALGIVHALGTYGVLRGRSWGWAVAIAYMGIGAASVLSQVAALLFPVQHFLFVPQALALLAAPYVLRNRHHLFTRPAYAG